MNFLFHGLLGCIALSSGRCDIAPHTRLVHGTTHVLAPFPGEIFSRICVLLLVSFNACSMMRELCPSLSLRNLGVEHRLFWPGLVCPSGQIVALTAFQLQVEPCKDVQRRVCGIKNAFLTALYGKVCHSLFEKDKLLFAFCLTCSLCQYIKGTIKPEEYSFFLTGSTSMCECHPNPTKWLPDKSWQEVLHASTLIPDLKDLPGMRQTLPETGGHTKAWSWLDRVCYSW
jgi:hypothetical protein